MTARGTRLNAPPFLGRMTAAKAFHFSVLGVTYGLAVASTRSPSSGLNAHAYFLDTYFGCIVASVALSVLALFFRPGMRLYAVLLLRAYVLIVFGYSIGAFLSARLVMGVGLMTEIGILADFAWALVISGVALAALALAQVLPAVFGSNSLVDSLASPTPDQFAAYCAVLAERARCG